jgi:hypothetical protein
MICCSFQIKSLSHPIYSVVKRSCFRSSHKQQISSVTSMVSLKMCEPDACSFLPASMSCYFYNTFSWEEILVVHGKSKMVGGQRLLTDFQRMRIGAQI